MLNIIIDEEFRFLLPELDSVTFTDLEESILKNGCRDALVLWQDILIDSYNRYTICKKHDIPFNTIEMEFDNREDVLIWIITNQVSRRNLTPIQLTHFRGVHYRAERKSHGGNIRGTKEISIRQNDGLKKSTAKHLSEKYKVSPRTIERDFKTAAAIDAIGETSPEAKRKILAGEVKIDRKTLKGLSAMQADELSGIVAKIEEGTFEKPNSAAQTNRSPDKSKEANTANKPLEKNTSQYSELQTLETLIGRITGGQYFDLQDYTKVPVSAASKAALRNHIDLLEDLYKWL